MAADYEVWLCDDLGQRLLLLEGALERLETLQRVNGPGWFNLTFGRGLPAGALGVDHQVQVWRRSTGSARLSLVFVGFLRMWRHTFAKDKFSTVLAGPDVNELLGRRIVAYAAGSSQATISGAADDGMKDVFAENFLSAATDADRDISGLDVTVQPDESAAQTVEMGFSWDNVLEVLQELSDAARTAGGGREGEVFFWLAPTGVDPVTQRVQLEFRTAVGRPGRDLAWQSAGGQPVVFGPALGNLQGAELAFDYRPERNFVYAGGQGHGAERVIKTASDTDRIAASAWNRRELFRDARNEDDPDAVQAVADAELAASRPVVRLEAQVLDTSQARYGRDWGLGDLVTVRVFGRQFDGLVRQVRLRLNKGEETVSVQVADEGV